MRMIDRAIPLIWAFALIAIAHPLTTAAGELRFLNWADYLDPELVEEFEAETGVTVVVDSFTESDIAEAMLLAGGSGYDLVVSGVGNLNRLREANAIQHLEADRIASVDDMDPSILDLIRQVDAEADRYSLLYLWGHTGVAYDEVAVRERLPETGVVGWDLIFNPEHAKAMSDCGIGIVDSVDEVASAALTYLGRDPTSKSPEDLDAAFAAISAIAPYVRSFSSSHYDELLAGEMCVALTWNTEGVSPGLEDEASTYRFAAPASGTNAWFDVFVIPADAQNVEDAYRFMEFIYRPENMARLAEWGYAAGALPEARALMPDYLSEHVGIFPDLDAALFYVLPQWTGAEKLDLDRRWRRAILGML